MRADLLDLVVAILLAEALELGPAGARSPRSSASAKLPSWISERTCRIVVRDVLVDDRAARTT